MLRKSGPIAIAPAFATNPPEGPEGERAAALRDKDRQELEDFKDEAATLAIDPDATSTLSGKMIRRRRTKATGGESASARRRLLELAVMDMTLCNARTLLEKASSLTGAFTDTISRIISPASSPASGHHRFEDEIYLFDTEQVSAGTARTLEAEAAILSKKIDALEEARSPALREEMALDIIEMAEQFQMMRHPHTGQFVHDIRRVAELERLLAPPGAERTAEICVFRIKAEIGDVKGVRKSISDQWNPNPEEVELTQAEKAAQAARPVLPPHLHHRHS